MNTKTDVLFLNAYFDPEVTSDRHISKAIVERLVSDGLNVIVRTPVPTRGVTEETREYYKHNKKETLYNGKLTILRFPLSRERSSYIQRTVRYLVMDIKHFISAMQIDAKCYFVDSTPPFHGIVTRIISRFTKTKYVFYLQDVFPQGFVTAGLLKEKSVIYQLFDKAQHKVYEEADRVLTISDQMKSDLINDGINADTIVTVQLWPDDSIHRIEREDNKLFDDYHLDRKKFYIVYGGNIGTSQNLEIMVDCARLCKERGLDIHFVIFGDGSRKEYLENYSKEKSLDNFHLLPMQTFSRVSEVYSLGDLATVICRKGTGAQNMPSKTWQIMATGAPILASYDIDSDLCNTITQNHLGYVSDAEDVEGFYNAVVSAYNNIDNLREIGLRCMTYVKEHNSCSIWTEKISKIVNSICVESE